MAKLASFPWSAVSQAGETIKFTSEVTVDSEGTFAVTIPTEMEDTARALATQYNDRPGRTSTRVAIDRAAVNVRVTGSDLQACKTFVRAAANEYIRAEVTEELVILYARNIQVAYVAGPTGELYANGYDFEPSAHDSDKPQWRGTLHATSDARFYSVGLAAVVAVKRTYTRAATVKVVYERAPTCQENRNSYRNRLNRFVGLRLEQPAMQAMSQMPYTEQAAGFFYELMLSLCRVADRLDGFLGDPQQLALAIERRAGLLPAPAPTGATESQLTEAAQ